jgi:hypothetical protein
VSDTGYRPGEIVPSSGVYRIEHNQHRLMHEATLQEGMKFPLCRECGDQVRFFLLRVLTVEVLRFHSTDILEEYGS